MQPIVTKSGNSAGFADFDNGLTPDIEIFERLNNLGVLGDPDERLLKTAIDHILGNITSISQSSNLNESFGRELINFSELKKQYLIIDDIEIDFD
jgi:carboxyl-terminal processing protease